MTRLSDIIAKMPDRAAILRVAALAAMMDARAAWKIARDRPSDANTRTAFRLCTLAARLLRRASEEHPSEEREMIERAMMLDEVAAGLKVQLVRLAG